jgi:hypothetical protein
VGGASSRSAVRTVGKSLLALGLTLVPWLMQPVCAQASGARGLITAPIDNNRLVRLAGNTHPSASASNDRGRVPDTLMMAHMQLLL